MRRFMAIGLGMLLGFATAWANDGGVTAATGSAASEAAATPGSTPASAADIARLIEQLGGLLCTGSVALESQSYFGFLLSYALKFFGPVRQSTRTKYGIGFSTFSQSANGQTI